MFKIRMRNEDVDHGKIKYPHDKNASYAESRRRSPKHSRCRISSASSNIRENSKSSPVQQRIHSTKEPKFEWLEPPTCCKHRYHFTKEKSLGPLRNSKDSSELITQCIEAPTLRYQLLIDRSKREGIPLSPRLKFQTSRNEFRPPSECVDLAAYQILLNRSKHSNVTSIKSKRQSKSSKCSKATYSDSSSRSKKRHKSSENILKRKESKLGEARNNQINITSISKEPKLPPSIKSSKSEEYKINSLVNCLKSRVACLVNWIAEKLTFVTKGFYEEVILDNFDGEAKYNLLMYLKSLGLEVTEIAPDKDGTKVFKVDVSNISCKSDVMNDLMVFIENERLNMVRRMSHELKKQSKESTLSKGSHKKEGISEPAFTGETAFIQSRMNAQKSLSRGQMQLPAEDYNFSSKNIISRIGAQISVEKFVEEKTKGGPFSRTYKKGYVTIPSESTDSGPLGKLQAEFEKFKALCTSPLLAKECNPTFSNIINVFDSKQTTSEDRDSKRSSTSQSKDFTKRRRKRERFEWLEDKPSTKLSSHHRETKEKSQKNEYPWLTDSQPSKISSLDKMAAFFEKERPKKLRKTVDDSRGTNLTVCLTKKDR